MTRLPARVVHLNEWRWLLGTLRADFATRSLAHGAEFVTDVTATLQGEATVPVLQLNRDRVLITLRDPNEGVTRREVALAERISEVAARHGVSAEPDRVQALELALDAPDEAAVRPFWAALLGLVDTGDDVQDPTGALPPLWFQQTDATAPDRQRFHLDITVPGDQAATRIEAAVRAGGRVVDRSYEPSFTVLADADGNLACVCTELGRE